LYHTSIVPLRPLTAVVALCLVGCLPEPARPPGARFDAGIPISFDVVVEETVAIDQPRVDRPVALDAGADVSDAPADRPAVTGDGPDPSRRYPSGPYGTLVGGVMQPFELADCAGTTFRFAGPDWVTARATLVEFTAGYCDGCVGLARLIQSDVNLPYRPRGLRVVGVLTDGSVPGDPATQSFCQQWVFQAGITHPMALDLASALRSHTDRLALPQWVLTDENGRILWRSAGSAAALAELRVRLDALLPMTP
jgi:hypothetical protein